ncbi:MAG: CARDB domain-containing protein [Candidatus Bathyarchaeia archaeon]
MRKVKKTLVLLFILALSTLSIIPIAIEAKVEKTDPVETNSGVGRPYQDIVGLDARSNGTHLSINVTLNQGPPKTDNETHINIYVTFDTASGGQNFFPDYTDAKYTNSADFWEWCLALYNWTGAVQDVDLINTAYVHTDAIAAGVTVTNSTDGTIVMMEIPLSVIGSPSNVTTGIITHEDGAHVPKDTIGNGIVHYEAWGQWIEVQPAIVDLPTGAGNSDSASDPTNDFIVKAFNDITEVEVGAEGSFVIVNVTFANVSGMDNTWIYDEQWDLSIALDTDQLATDANQTWIMGVSDVRIDLTANDTFWERNIVLDSLTSIQYYDENQNNLGASGITATLLAAEHKVKVSIPQAVIPFGPDRKLNLTVVSGMDYASLFCDVVGTWSYTYDPAVNTQGYYSILTGIPSTERIEVPWPGPAAAFLPDVIGRPYQDIVGVNASSDGTTLSVNVTLNQGPPKQNNETHVNIYVAIDNGTAEGNWEFPDYIDAGYNNSDYYWEYCLALYNWTGAVQDVDMIYMNWTHVNATALGVTVTNSTDGKTLMIDIPLTAIGSPPNVTIGVVTSEDYAKVRDTVGNGIVRLSSSQWIQVEPAMVDLLTGAGNSDSASDPVGDFVGKAFWDIRGVTAAQQYNNVVINVTFLNVTTLPWSWGQWRLSIAMDMDHVDGSGQPWMTFLGYSDAKIDPAVNDTYWERSVVVDSPTEIHLYDENFNDLGPSGITAYLDATEDKVVVSIPKVILPPSPDRSLNLTIISGMDGGNTIYDVASTYAYAYDPAVNTQGYYLITTTIPPTGPVMYPFPPPGIPFNDAMGRPYQDIIGVDASSDGTNLSVNVTLNQGPPRRDNETHVNIYVAIDTADGGRDWFPDDIDARYNLSTPEHFWEYCLALYSWTGLIPQDVDLIDVAFGRSDALNNPTANATVTNSTDGTIVMINIPLALIGSPSTVTIGVVTSEDYAKIRDTVGNGTVRLVASQWIEVQPAMVDLLTGAGNSDSASDPTSDFVGKAYWDITGVTVGGGGGSIVVNATFANVTGLSWSWGQWRLSIAIDTDQADASGESWMGFIGYSDTKIDPAANDTYWERCVVVDSPTDIHVYKPDWTDAGANGTTASLISTQNKVTVSIPHENLQLGPDGKLTFTVISGMDGGNTVYDVYGTHTYTYNTTVNTQGFHLITTDPTLKGLVVHDVAVTQITTLAYSPADGPHVYSTTYVYVGDKVNITVTVMNQGTLPENFTVTVYNGTTPIGSPVNITNLAPGNQTSITVTWNTAGINVSAWFNHTIKDYIGIPIKANVSVVTGEAEIYDNTLIGTIKVRLNGDIDGNGEVDIVDVVIVALAFGSKPGDLNWNPEADIKPEWDLIDIVDIVAVAIHFGDKC